MWTPCGRFLVKYGQSSRHITKRRFLCVLDKYIFLFAFIVFNDAGQLDIICLQGRDFWRSALFNKHFPAIQKNIWWRNKDKKTKKKYLDLMKQKSGKMSPCEIFSKFRFYSVDSKPPTYVHKSSETFVRKKIGNPFQ